MRISIVVAALMLSGGVAAVASVPTPRPRPANLGQATTPAPAAPEADVETDQPSAAGGAGNAGGAAKTQTDAAAQPPSACQAVLKQIAMFAPHAAVKGAGQCGIDDPVTLDAVVLRDNTHIALNPPALLRCDMATAVAKWVREDMAPIAVHLGSPLRGIENYDSYDCRGRNRVVGAKMSEHGRGNALDVKALKLASGAVAHLTDTHVSKEVRNALRTSACSRFMTVLGPGSDGYHEEHVHVDLAPRRHAYSICQWDVRQPMERAAPSPLIASSRTPTAHETMPDDTIIPVVSAHAAPRTRRAAERR